MKRSPTVELRHQKAIRKFSLRNAKETAGALRDLFLFQAARAEEKIAEIRLTARKTTV
jgi:hypothetical protein